MSVLIYMTDRNKDPNALLTISRLPAGSVVIIREYDARDREQFARSVRALCRVHRLYCVVAADYGLARRIRADGVHLPDHLLFSRPRSGLPVFSAACHGRRSLRRAQELAIPFVLVSPVFATTSHAGKQPLGIHRFARLTSGIRDRVIALGGVNARTVRPLRRLGIAGIAAIDAFNSATKG
ncbi:thiamine phosphate synthase [Kordiimonas sediminis]|nr:thiamine phosphate synthase [Kordiimonas sediminis]